MAERRPASGRKRAPQGVRRPVAGRRPTGPRPPIPVFKAVSFDCFGTLVDWDAGLAAAVAGELGVHPDVARQSWTEAIHDAEWEILETLEDFRPYRAIVTDSVVRAGMRLGFPVARERAARIAASVDNWPLFADVVPALQRLAKSFPLAIVSNADRADLESTARRLGVRFARLVAATDVANYKPEPDHLMALLHELALDEGELLHVSAYPEYDLQTAEDLGVPAVYIDRRGLPLSDEVTVLATYRDLGALADALLSGRLRRNYVASEF